MKERERERERERVGVKIREREMEGETERKRQREREGGREGESFLIRCIWKDVMWVVYSFFMEVTSSFIC